MIKLLIVEDDISIANLINMSLSKRGYKCVSANNGRTAADIIENESFDLVLLDIMLPEIDGYQLLEFIKEYNIPVIFVTAKSDISDRVKGLNCGAEDYIVKPFALAELNARVDNVLRRHSKLDNIITIHDITVDTGSMVVTKCGEAVELTIKEYELLLFLIRNRGIALYREQIYENVWHEAYYGDTRTVDMHIQRLRKKLNWHDELKSIYKVGYRLI